nr:RDD family protein [Ornithinimicrobium cryptoxanthini]
MASAERQQQAWEAGGEGERLVARALREACWPALHDQAWPGRPRANIDHVALSLSRIWMIDAKHWSGDVTIRQGVLRQNGYRRTDYLEKARDAAEAMASVLPAASPRVAPMICLTQSGRDLPATLVDGVIVVGVTHLSRALGPAPEEYEELAGLVADVRESLHREAVGPPRHGAVRATGGRPVTPPVTSTATSRRTPSMSLPSQATRLAPWGLRARATVVDWALMALPLIAASTASPSGDLDMIGGWVWLLLIFVFAWMNGRHGSPGKRLFGLRVARAKDGTRLGGWRGLLRGFLLLLTLPATAGLLFVISLLWPLVDRRKQTLHDKAVGAVVTVTRAVGM